MKLFLFLYLGLSFLSTSHLPLPRFWLLSVIFRLPWLQAFLYVIFGSPRLYTFINLKHAILHYFHFQFLHDESLLFLPFPSLPALPMKGWIMHFVSSKEVKSRTKNLFCRFRNFLERGSQLSSKHFISFAGKSQAIETPNVFNKFKSTSKPAFWCVAMFTQTWHAFACCVSPNSMA